MADDTQRPEDHDETPVNPPTGEVGGADWLISQIDAARTGQFDTRLVPREGADSAASPRPGRAGENPVLAWWRDKLIAADALVNPEPRPESDDQGVTGDQTATIDDATTPAAADDATTPAAVDEGVTLDKASKRDKDARRARDLARENSREEPSVPGVVIPEPARFERPQEKEQAAGHAEPEPVFLPEPAFTPVWTPMPSSGDDSDIMADTNRGWGLGTDSDLSSELGPTPTDEAETGLIPSAEPPLYQPKSARDRLAEEEEGSGLPVPAEPDPGDAPEYVTEDLDNFSWKLTANDHLDPRVHRRDEEASTPASAPGSVASESTADAEDSDTSTAPRQRRPEDEEETALVHPAVFADREPASPGPRRRTFASPTPDNEPAAAGATSPDTQPGAKPARKALRPARPAAARAPRPVILAAIGIVGLLVLSGLFFLGSQLPGLLAAPAPAASPAPAQTTTPTTPAAPVGPAAPGEQDWTALGGGECVEPYSSPWAETFTVVDCGEPHTAQMVFTGQVNEDAAAEYPGADEILSQISLRCSAPGVLDAEAASEYPDLQVQGTYPVSEEQWAGGQRNFYCFVSRSNGEPLTGSVAAPQG